MVSGKTGGQVRLGDIATITRRLDRAEEKILFNGQRAALLEVAKTDSQDALRVMDAIQQNLDRERLIAPRGISFEISQDTTSNIRTRLRILISNGAQGLVLVFFVLWAFFSLRYSFWVTMGLPVSFLGAIFAMQLLGYTLNMFTLVALLVAIGLLMDDAIVISENVAAQIRSGKSVADAAVEGVIQVAPGVLSSFVTTIMVVGPLAFMSGKMGAILKYLPAVLVITLAISLIEAFLILPAHLHHSGSHLDESHRSAFHRWFDKRFAALRDRLFEPLVGIAVGRPYLSLGLILATH